eukprot:UN11760
MVILRDANAPQKTKSAYVFSVKNRTKVVKTIQTFFCRNWCIAGKMWTETSDKARTPFLNR